MNRESVSFAEAAQLLGVSKMTIRRAVRRGRLEAFRVEGCVRIYLAELRRYKRVNVVQEVSDGIRE